ncbi:hypothetical protein [Pedobacter sp. MW01-1-1]|uniref:hypothetical protein n=1 Tax=Pedobacter sp. MW01-1-1 TaxID=3383027 RepID=UPI003FF057BB
MIPSTQALITYLTCDEKEQQAAVVDSYVKSILKLGTKEDALALLPVYLDNFDDFRYSDLVTLFVQFGDNSFAEKIFSRVFIDNQLVEGADPYLLEVLGVLKFEPIKSIAFEYAFQLQESDYYLQKYAVLCLLNFDCSEYIDTLKTAIEDCLHKNLFSEFVPALVSKIPNPSSLLEELYESGESIASTDCNAGMVLGFSLCGDEGRTYFRKMLFNPNWEANSTSTGTLRYTYLGLQQLNISFAELYEEIKAMSDLQEVSYALEVLFSLLDCRMADYTSSVTESFIDLYTLFFSRESPTRSNNLIDVADRVGKEMKAYEYEAKIEKKITEDIILMNTSLLIEGKYSGHK